LSSRSGKTFFGAPRSVLSVAKSFFRTLLDKSRLLIKIRLRSFRVEIVVQRAGDEKADSGLGKDALACELTGGAPSR
jgi:hypothetical protein